MATTTSITPKCDYGRRYAIISGYDERIKAWSRKQYLTFEAAQDNTQVLFVAETGATTKTVSVSTDNGLTWDNKTSSNEGTVLATLDRGEKVLVKGSNNAYYASKNNSFSASGPVYCYGNIHSLIAGDNFVGHTTLSGNSVFRGLFQGFANLRTDPKKGYIILPASTAPNWAYNNTFADCPGMTFPPIVDASSIGMYTCANMLKGDTSLLEPLEFPYLRTITGSAAFNGFCHGCTSLKKAVIPLVSEITTDVFNSAYYGCTGIKRVPGLTHITQVALRSFYRTFFGCSGLEGSAIFPDVTLAESCYGEMFWNSGLEEIYLPSATLAKQSYSSLVRQTRVKKITCLATDITASNCLQNWVIGVPSGGTFIKAASMTGWPSGASGIPTGWTVQDYNA